MFLFSKEGPDNVRDLYDFSPYAYGPFDTAVYGDLDILEARGLIRCSVVLGTNRRVFELSSQGQKRFEQLLEDAPPDGLAALRGIKEKLTSLGFVELLKFVYDKYPKYASRSVVNP